MGEVVLTGWSCVVRQVKDVKSAGAKQMRWCHSAFHIYFVPLLTCIPRTSPSATITLALMIVALVGIGITMWEWL